ncbi:CGP-CTERM sorting domain-containing protein [Pyrococcus yayanosii]|uniref:CGP-CTERM sorting domain-containing protein n=1 Tax=Pyrococcus yayanosii (strain CH1 / JCM 16557) TaxID=529709 RepID=F8AIJ8_PYRYC|nr:CGP-CTERM sorting domain-containing protein [Pyrococcus yayanosii]AEH24364.1 hypothetical protein PYCH_06760 [Pyrococcus yayanosii CH1]
MEADRTVLGIPCGYSVRCAENKTIVILFLSLTLFSRAVVSVESGGYVYNVRYSVISNGSDAFVPLLILTYEPYCPPLSGINCANATTGEVLGGNEYLFYFNDAQLYILNFTPAFRALYPNYSTLLDQFRALYHYTLRHSLNGARFINGSWYLDLTFYPPMTHVYGIYRFNPSKFCIEPVNVRMRGFTLPSSVGGLALLSVLSKDCLLAVKNSEGWPLNDNPNPGLPVGVTGRRPGLRAEPKLVTGVGDGPANRTASGEGLTRWNPRPSGRGGGQWFPDSVKIANVTVCKTSADTSTKTVETNGTTYTTKMSPNTTKTPTNTKETKKGICGPGLISLLVVIPLILRRR